MIQLGTTVHQYPDLIAAGGLCNAVQSALAELGSTLSVSGLDAPSNFPVYARVESGSRFSQIYTLSGQECDIEADGVSSTLRDFGFRPRQGRTRLAGG
jgi:hypothetical protein